MDVKKLPKAGKIVKETENKKLGYKELTLSNGARVILKKTDFQANDVRSMLQLRVVAACTIRQTLTILNYLIL